MDFLNMKTLLLGNTTVRQTILKNAFWLTASTVTNKLLALGLVIYAARILGAEGYGQFTFALAFVSLLMVFAYFGLPPIVTREFAREKERSEEFYSLLSLKILLALGTFVLIAAFSFFMPSAQNIQLLIFVLAGFFLLNSFIGICYALFHARQKMEYEAWFETAQSLLVVAFGFAVLFQFPSPVNLGYAYFFAGLGALGALLVFFHMRIFPLRIAWDIAVWKKFMRMSWPLALIGVFGAIYSFTDSVMLGYWGLIIETGWYNAAYKLVTASLIPMGFIGAAFYPMLSKFSRESKEKLQKVWEHEIEIMILLAVPLVIGGVALASNIISTFYTPEFAPSILAFQILIGTAGFIFLYRPLYDAMIVLDQERKTFWITMTGAVLNVVLNFILIPLYSLYGAAIATVGTHASVLLIMLFFIKRFTFLRFPVFRIFLTFTFSLVSSGVMYAFLVWALGYTMHVFFVVPGGAAVYFAALFFLRRYVALQYFKQAYVYV